MRSELPGKNKTTNKQKRKLKRRLSAGGKIWAMSWKFQLESTMEKMCSLLRTDLTILHPFNHQPDTYSKKSSYTNNHSCEKFHWPVPLTPHPYSLAVNELVWLLEREEGNDNRMTVPTIPTANWQLTMGPGWRMGEELLSQVSSLPLLVNLLYPNISLFFFCPCLIFHPIVGRV